MEAKRGGVQRHGNGPSPVSAPPSETCAVEGDLPGFDLSFAAATTCIVLVAINLRPGIVSIGPLLPGIRQEFGLSHASASLLIAIPDLLMGALALPTPWLARRYGRDRVLLGALLLLFAATATRAFAPSTTVLLLTTAGVGAGIAVAGALVAGFVKAGFPDRAALMMSLYATALALGSTLSAAVSAPIAEHAGGWRAGSGAWSLLGLSAIAAWLFVERHERRAGRARPGGRRHALPVGDPKAWLVAFFFAFDNLLFYGLLSTTAPLYREEGLSATQAGLVLATFIGGTMVATPIFGALSRDQDRRVPLALSAALAVAGLLLMAAAPAVSPFLSILVVAFGVGGGFTLGMTLPLDNARDPDEAGVWTAFVLTVGYLVAAAGPLTLGALRDLSGDFDASLGLLIGVGIAMLALTPFLRPRSVREPTVG